MNLLQSDNCCQVSPLVEMEQLLLVPGYEPSCLVLCVYTFHIPGPNHPRHAFPLRHTDPPFQYKSNVRSLVPHSSVCVHYPACHLNSDSSPGAAVFIAD